MIELNLSECEFQLSSVMDPVGRVFNYQGRILRGIRAPYVDSVRQVLSLATEHKWSDLGLIPAWETEYCLPEYPLVLEHKRVPFVTVRAEWCGEALRDAALCYLRLAVEAARHGFCLKDSHTWNLLFDSCTPYFVDWGSIRPIAELNWEHWYAEFRKYFLAPLHLFARGKPALARAMLREHCVGAGIAFLDLPSTRRVPKGPYLIFERRSECSAEQVFSELAEYVASLSLPRAGGEWVSYQQPRFSGLADQSTLRWKDQVVHRLMASDPYATVLDVGCNYGVHSEICADLGKRVVALDVEEPCVDDLYLRTKQSGRDILPLYFDCRWPVGESGFMNTIASVHDRLACDTVLVMAVVHHLACRQGASFDAIAWNISRFARRRAIVEIIPLEDVHVYKWDLGPMPWYNLERFLDAMGKYFRRHEVLPSDPSPRQVLVFDGKREQVRAADVEGDQRLEQALKQLAGEESSTLWAYKQRLQDLEKSQRALEKTIAEYRDAIAAMETSKFWRLRSKWVKVRDGIKRVVGRSAG
jgi:hypothetical protein